MSSSGDIAANLRHRINSGAFPPGSQLPTNAALMAEHGVSKATVTKAISELVDEGLVFTAKKGGTRVRHRTQVQLPLSRYSRALAPGGTRGPWETATYEAGLNGLMELIHVESVEAPEDLAALLELSPTDSLIYRLRHAIIRPDDLVQLQHAWYPRDIAEAAGIDTAEKIEGGIYRKLAAAGHRRATASETVAVRMPTTDETALLRLGGRVSVITVERVTKDAAGRPIEVLRAVAAADRLKFTYDDLPLLPPNTEA
ncbi:GntR family transcriptional regulator [Streptomyces sp. NRRL F-5702]|uniref:GntR family transcriptional regulator n=1 Tax=Streptomyces sp. NRRL F-5702 TaxID=1463870 RepID=UPI0004C6D659|nr:GntR family transcriptional regulator [Streptomyces sp. NRRL F-5702]